MAILESVGEVTSFIKRRPELQRSKLLEKETRDLEKALAGYLAKAQEIEITLSPEYSEALALMNGDGKSLVTGDFMAKFCAENCGGSWAPTKRGKDGKKEFLLLVAKKNKLGKLKKALDPGKKYRELLAEMLLLTEKEIQQRISTIKADAFRGLVETNGFEAARTGRGAISTARENKTKVATQIIHMKKSDQCLSGLRDAD